MSTKTKQATINNTQANEERVSILVFKKASKWVNFKNLITTIAGAVVITIGGMIYHKVSVYNSTIVSAGQMEPRMAQVEKTLVSHTTTLNNLSSGLELAKQNQAGLKEDINQLRGDFKDGMTTIYQLLLEIKGKR